MIELIEIKTDSALYNYAEQLMTTSFPQEERRDTEQQRWYTDYKTLFHYCIIMDNAIPLGLLTYWDFQTFIYIEHFAIDNKLRNLGYGKQALKAFTEQIKLPIVLEVEEPTNETSKRRISFYEHQGFTLHELPYLQPPYRKDDTWFPLKLMTYGEIDMHGIYEEVKERIYREVYNQ